MINAVDFPARVCVTYQRLRGEASPDSPILAVSLAKQAIREVGAQIRRENASQAPELSDPDMVGVVMRALRAWVTGRLFKLARLRSLLPELNEAVPQGLQAVRNLAVASMTDEGGAAVRDPGGECCHRSIG